MLLLEVSQAEGYGKQRAKKASSASPEPQLSLRLVSSSGLGCWVEKEWDTIPDQIREARQRDS